MRHLCGSLPALPLCSRMLCTSCVLGSRNIISACQAVPRVVKPQLELVFSALSSSCIVSLLEVPSLWEGRCSIYLLLTLQGFGEAQLAKTCKLLRDH